MIVFNHINEAIVLSLENNFKPAVVELGVVKSKAFIAAMEASGGVPEHAGDTYFCGLLVKLDSPIPGVTVH